jgi:hypothetical protein
MKRLAVVVLALAAAGCGGGSRAASQPSTITPTGGNTYTAQVDTYLSRLGSNARNQGYTRMAAGPVYGSIRDDETASHTMEVVGGNQYALMGACDNDCTDVDLKIYDQSGTLLMQDIAVDDTPVLLFTANGSGRYRVQVIMATCNRNPCFYGVQLMAR